MQIRCQRCGWAFTLSREAITEGLAAAEETGAKHHSLDCPKCRHLIKVPVKRMRRYAPRSE